MYTLVKKLNTASCVHACIALLITVIHAAAAEQVLDLCKSRAAMHDGVGKIQTNTQQKSLEKSYKSALFFTRRLALCGAAQTLVRICTKENNLIWRRLEAGNSRLTCTNAVEGSRFTNCHLSK